MTRGEAPGTKTIANFHTVVHIGRAELIKGKR